MQIRWNSRLGLTLAALSSRPVDYILFITAPVTTKPNVNEVCDTRWVNQEELSKLMNELDRECADQADAARLLTASSPSPASSFTPWFKLIVSKFLFPWWSKLLERRTSRPQSETAAKGASDSESVVDAKSLSDFQDQDIHRML